MSVRLRLCVLVVRHHGVAMLRCIRPSPSSPNRTMLACMTPFQFDALVRFRHVFELGSGF